MIRRALGRVALLSLVAFTVAAPAVAQELPRAEPEEVGMSSERLARLTDALQAYVDDGQLAGAVASVTRRGHVVYTAAVGSSDRGAVEGVRS